MARKPQRGKKGRPAAKARRTAATERGRTAGKVAGFDPAAAPLGTDAESAGAPPAPLPEAPAPAADLAADPAGTERRGYRLQDRLVWPIILVMLLVAAAAAAAVYLLG
jgi:hypothetical protein